MYVSHGVRGGDKKSKFLSGDGRIEDHWFKENIPSRRRALTLSDLKLQAEMRKGDKVEQDISCDSKSMLGIMDKLGNSNRSTYRSIGVTYEEIIYLVMDNAGGDGINEAVIEYSEYMAANHNIEVHHQVPQSPKTKFFTLVHG